MLLQTRLCFCEKADRKEQRMINYVEQQFRSILMKCFVKSLFILIVSSFFVLFCFSRWGCIFIPDLAMNCLIIYAYIGIAYCFYPVWKILKHLRFQILNPIICQTCLMKNWNYSTFFLCNWAKDWIMREETLCFVAAHRKAKTFSFPPDGCPYVLEHLICQKKIK